MHPLNNGADDFWGDPIFSYTRAQAIADGVLVDLCALAPNTCAFLCPSTSVACTEAVWRTIERALDGATDRRAVAHVIHDVLAVAFAVRFREILAQAAAEGSTEQVLDVALRGAAERRALKYHVGPGDRGDLVVTIMEPHED